MITLLILLRAYDWVLTSMRAFGRELFALMGFENYCSVGGLGGQDLCSVSIKNN